MTEQPPDAKPELRAQRGGASTPAAGGRKVPPLLAETPKPTAAAAPGLAAKKPVTAGKPRGPAKKSGGGGGSWFGRFIMWGFSLAALGMIAGVAGIMAIIFYYGAELPDYRSLEKHQPKIVTRAYAVDGRLLAEFAAEKRIFIPVENVPERVIQAFLSAEDKNFYTHPGIDVVGIARAVVTNLRNPGGRPVGASTITQQVAKNFLLTNEVSIARKIKEAILAFRIEEALSKDQILELYLNEIFLGQRAYGVAAASLEYFNKPLNELSIDEAAYLAALPKGPNNYHPVRRYDDAVGRRNWVIEEMVDNGYIDRTQAELAKVKPLLVVRRDEDQYVNHPYFAEEVRRKLLDSYGEQGLYEGGLIVHTTMRPRYQAIAEKALRSAIVEYDMRHGLHTDAIASIPTTNWQEEIKKVPYVAGQGDFEQAVILESNDKRAVIGLGSGAQGIITYNKMKWASRKGQTPAKVSDLLKVGDVWLVQKTDEKDGKAPIYGLRQIPKVQGGMIAMDPHTGRIFAIAGGFSYDISQFNRASQAIRQPGSAFKPFVYLAGLEAGFTPATLILDAPFVFDQGPGLAKWRPQNYTEDFGGPTTLRVGLEKSRNLMTIRLANYVGMEKVAQITEKFGVTDHLPRMLSMSIGAGETTLLRMANAYSVFVNGGKKVTPTLIDRIQDKNGKTIYVHDQRPCDGCGPMIPWTEDQAVPSLPDLREQIADPRHMYQIVSMLEGVVQRGTGIMVKDVGRPVAGKTGTTNDSKDVWFMGFTPDLVVGIYVGFDEPRTLGAKETGSRVAAPAFKQFIAEALKDVPPTPFRVPEGIRLVQINAATGTRAAPGDSRAIYEAFVAGTEPGDEPMMFTGSGVSTVTDVIQAGESAETGLGGLY